MSGKHVEIVVVSWNSEEDLGECLDCLARHTDHPNYRVTVIDNDSRDGTRAILRQRSGEVRVIELNCNTGWTGAINFAFRTVLSDYYFFLNPDARVQPGWLAPLVEALERRPDCGFAAPKFLSSSSVVYSQGFRVGHALGIEASGHGRLDGGDEMPRLVPLCSGMFLVRRDVIERIGLLDDGFGLGYYEDMDYVLRGLYAGFRTVFVPRSRILHLVGRSFDRLGSEKTRLMIHNWLRMITLHWPIRWLVLRLLIEAARPLRWALRGQSPIPAIRAWRTWAAQLPVLWTRRRELAPLRAGMNWSILRDE